MRAPDKIKRQLPLFQEDLKLICSTHDDLYSEIALYELDDDDLKDLGEYWLVAITDRDELNPLAYGTDEELLCDWTTFGGVKPIELEPALAYFTANRRRQSLESRSG